MLLLRLNAMGCDAHIWNVLLHVGLSSMMPQTASGSIDSALHLRLAIILPLASADACLHWQLQMIKPVTFKPAKMSMRSLTMHLPRHPHTATTDVFPVQGFLNNCSSMSTNDNS